MSAKFRHINFLGISTAFFLLTLLSACGGITPKASLLMAKPEKNTTSVKIIYITNSLSDPQRPDSSKITDDPEECAGLARYYLKDIRYFEMGDYIEMVAPEMLAKRNVVASVDLLSVRRLASLVDDVKKAPATQDNKHLLVYFSEARTTSSANGLYAVLNLSAVYKDIQTGKVYWMGNYEVTAYDSLLQNIFSNSKFKQKNVQEMLDVVFNDMERAGLLPPESNKTKGTT